MDKYEVKCFDKRLLSCLDNSNNDGFYGDFLHANPLEYFLEETLVGKCLVQHGYKHKVVWCETYDHFYYQHNYKTQMIYHDKMNDGREKGCYDT